MEKTINRFRNLLSFLFIFVGLVSILIGLSGIKFGNPQIPNIPEIFDSEQSEVDKNKVKTSENEDVGSILDKALFVERVSDTPPSSNVEKFPTGHSENGYAKSYKNAVEILQTKIWQATDYQFQDILEPTYTVQLGDTLWEIAEGYYGYGSRWLDILEKNKNLIGFLPNGEQALIFPGQVLHL